MVEPDLRWFYFRYDTLELGLTNLAYVRVQHETGPMLTLNRGLDYAWGVEFALYVKM